MAIPHTYTAFKVLKSGELKCLYSLLDKEQRPFEMVVYQALAGVRPVAILATNKEDAKYFSKVLNNIANGHDNIKE